MKVRKRLLSLLLAVCMAVSLALPAAAADVPTSGYEYTDTDNDGTVDTALVYTADGLRAVLESSEYTKMTVSLQNDITVPLSETDTVAVPELVFDGNGHTITVNPTLGNQYLFTFSAGVETVEFKNVSFISDQPDILTGLLETVSTGQAAVTLGQGVKISGFTAGAGASNTGGIIHFYNNNSLTIDGAEITGNTGNIIVGGISVASSDSTITMLSGTIHDNNLQNYQSGYAVLLYGNKKSTTSTFTMTGGTISGNTGGSAVIYGYCNTSSACTVEVGGTAQIIDNTCTNGAIYGTRGSVTVKDSAQVTGNELLNVTSSSVTSTKTQMPMDIKITGTAPLTIGDSARVDNVSLAPGVSVVSLTGPLQSDVNIGWTSYPTSGDDITVVRGTDSYTVTAADAEHVKFGGYIAYGSAVSIPCRAAVWNEADGTIDLQRLPVSISLDGYEEVTVDGLPVFQSYIGAGAVTPSVTITVGEEAVPQEIASSPAYTLTYTDNTPGMESHEAAVTVTPASYSDFEGGTVRFWIEVAPPTSLEDNADITVTVADVYGVEGVTPTVRPIVKDGDTVLVNGTDYTYTVAISEDGKSGAVTVTGMTKYTGTVTQTFQIKSPDDLPEGSTLVWDEATLNAAIADRAEHIVFANDIDVASPVSVGAAEGAAYTVTLDGAGHYLTSSTLTTIDTAANDSLLVAEDGVNLTLDNLVLDGQCDVRTVGVRTLWVKAGATVTVSASAALENSGTKNNVTGAAIYAEEGAAVTVAGVIRNSNTTGAVIYNAGTLEIAEGALLTNIPVAGEIIHNKGTLTMNGGEIRPGPYYYGQSGGLGAAASSGGGNAGSIVLNDGDFTMNVGLITGDNGDQSGTQVFYGAVFNRKNFTMNGGVITGFMGRGVLSGGSNGTTYPPSSAGGVYNLGEFTLNDGEISNNISAPNGSFGAMASNGVSDFGGGGVINENIFTMNGGKITGNTSAYNGGGVYISGYYQKGVEEAAVFIMNGGEISGNTAMRGGGGGVYLSNFGGEFTMTGGTITGNTAIAASGEEDAEPDNGGIGFMIGSSNKIVTGAGGGVYVSGRGYRNGISISADLVGDRPNGVFNLLGGEISGNTAEIGAGVYVSPTGGKNNGGMGAMSGTNTVYEPAVMNIGGDPVVTDAVYLPTVTSEDGTQTSSASFTITEALTEGASFSVDGVALGALLATYAEGVTAGETDTDAFTPADESLKAALRDGQLLLCGLIDVTFGRVSDLTYTGEEQTISISVAYGNTELTEGTDYTVTYADNVNAGIATATVQGVGNYTGTAEHTFTILPADLSQAAINVAQDSCSYTGSPVTPDVSVALGVVTLEPDTDYEVAYADNVDVGTATITITGIGNYTGTATASFTIAEHIHQWDDGVVTKEATTTEEGEITYTCTVCGETKTETIPVLAPRFTDVADDAFYAAAVNWAVERKITAGTGNNRFSPLSTCSRAEIVTFLYRAAGSPEVDVSLATQFSDVAADAFYAKAVAWAVEKGITSGTGNGQFSPLRTCTRAEIVTFLWRYAGKPAATASASFTDVKDSDFYAAAVAWAVEKKITAGTGNNRFSPLSTCTRAEAVTFLYRADQA